MVGAMIDPAEHEVGALVARFVVARVAEEEVVVTRRARFAQEARRKDAAGVDVGVVGPVLLQRPAAEALDHALVVALGGLLFVR